MQALSSKPGFYQLQAPQIYPGQFPGLTMPMQQPLQQTVEVLDQGLNRCTSCKRVCKIYARKLCTTFYYQSNRLKKCTKCRHAGTRPHYSKGLCRKCYLTSYYMIRKGKIPNIDEPSEPEQASLSHSEGKEALHPNEHSDLEKLPLKSDDGSASQHRPDSVSAQRSEEKP